MTKSVFYLGASAPGFCDLAPVNDADSQALVAAFDGTSMLARWSPLEVEPIREHPELGTDLGDYARLGSVPTFSARAVEVLGTLLTDHGELLPLRMAPKYFAFNATTILDALDEARSSIVRFAGGKVMMINKFTFRPEPVRTAIVFKLPQLHRSKVFVTEIFVDLAMNAELRGFGCERVWTESS